MVKKKKITRKNMTGCGEFRKIKIKKSIKKEEDFEKAGVSWCLGMFSVSVNAGVSPGGACCV